MNDYSYGLSPMVSSSLIIKNEKEGKLGLVELDKNFFSVGEFDTTIVEPNKDYSVVGEFGTSSTNPLMMAKIDTQSPIISIVSGSGQVRIFSDGKIVLYHTNLDEASKEFWNRIELAFPIFKQKIIDDYVKQRCSCPCNTLTNKEKLK
jgi:hypothetical protein